MYDAVRNHSPREILAYNVESHLKTVRFWVVRSSLHYKVNEEANLRSVVI